MEYILNSTVFEFSRFHPASIRDAIPGVTLAKKFGDPIPSEVAELVYAYNKKQWSVAKAIGYLLTIVSEGPQTTPFNLSQVIARSSTFCTDDDVLDCDVHVTEDDDSESTKRISISVQNGYAVSYPSKGNTVQSNQLACELATDYVCSISVINGELQLTNPAVVPEAFIDYAGAAISHMSKELLIQIPFSKKTTQCGLELASTLYTKITQSDRNIQIHQMAEMSSVDPPAIVDNADYVQVQYEMLNDLNKTVLVTKPVRSARIRAKKFDCSRFTAEEAYAYVKSTKDFVGTLKKGAGQFSSMFYDGVPLDMNLRKYMNYTQVLLKYLPPAEIIEVFVDTSDQNMALFMYENLLTYYDTVRLAFKSGTPTSIKDRSILMSSGKSAFFSISTRIPDCMNNFIFYIISTTAPAEAKTYKQVLRNATKFWDTKHENLYTDRRCIFFLHYTCLMNLMPEKVKRYPKDKLVRGEGEPEKDFEHRIQVYEDAYDHSCDMNRGWIFGREQFWTYACRFGHKLFFPVTNFNVGCKYHRSLSQRDVINLTLVLRSNFTSYRFHRISLHEIIDDRYKEYFYGTRFAVIRNVKLAQKYGISLGEYCGDSVVLDFAQSIKDEGKRIKREEEKQQVPLPPPPEAKIPRKQRKAPPLPPRKPVSKTETVVIPPKAAPLQLPPNVPLTNKASVIRKESEESESESDDPDANEDDQDYGDEHDDEKDEGEEEEEEEEEEGEPIKEGPAKKEKKGKSKQSKPASSTVVGKRPRTNMSLF